MCDMKHEKRCSEQYKYKKNSYGTTVNSAAHRVKEVKSIEMWKLYSISCSIHPYAVAHASCHDSTSNVSFPNQNVMRMWQPIDAVLQFHIHTITFSNKYVVLFNPLSENHTVSTSVLQSIMHSTSFLLSIINM